MIGKKKEPAIIRTIMTLFLNSKREIDPFRNREKGVKIKELR